ncbi:MAG: ATP-binding protein [Planctomycetia bacterium]|nr:ATP-binding protein [Planctomycetia bacterium]
MKVNKLRIENVGPLKRADVEFGDLTVLVGPQAGGKSVFLQLLKLVVDNGAVPSALRKYGLDWGKDVCEFLDIYLGEGMGDAWDEAESAVVANGEKVSLRRLVGQSTNHKPERLFFIPAQRVLTLGQGWPRPFDAYSPGDPFAVRDFSEKLRAFLEGELRRGDVLFPKHARLSKPAQEALFRNLFGDFLLTVDKQGPQKRLVLTPIAKFVSPDRRELPFMVWSAGQREFIPLLLGLYWLISPAKSSRRNGIEWVVIEELEMGLHPRAISTALVLVLELLARGYRVCLSTHSPHVLDLVWALRVFRDHHAPPKKLLELFELDESAWPIVKAKSILKKDVRVFFFDTATKETKDISRLDPGASSADESGWGGLTDFSGHVADVVASVVNGSAEST